MGERADEMLGRALQALQEGDLAAADAVVEADRARPAYEQVQHGVLATIALHGPVGRDLRLLTALLHVSLHLERMGDYAVNVARTVKRAAATRRPTVTCSSSWSRWASWPARSAATPCSAFVQATPTWPRGRGPLDDAVDRLNVGIFHRLVRLAADDEDRLEWATRMIQLTRQLERYADHGVDVAEQAVFVATGQPRAVRPTRRAQLSGRAAASGADIDALPGDHERHVLREGDPVVREPLEVAAEQPEHQHLAGCASSSCARESSPTRSVSTSASSRSTSCTARASRWRQASTPRRNTSSCGRPSSSSCCARPAAAAARRAARRLGDVAHQPTGPLDVVDQPQHRDQPAQVTRRRAPRGRAAGTPAPRPAGTARARRRSAPRPRRCRAVAGEERPGDARHRLGDQQRRHR
jgi:phosphate transport system protein